MPVLGPFPAYLLGRLSSDLETSSAFALHPSVADLFARYRGRSGAIPWDSGAARDVTGGRRPTPRVLSPLTEGGMRKLNSPQIPTAPP